MITPNTIVNRIIIEEINGKKRNKSEMNRPEIEHEIYLKIDSITDYYNGLPPFSFLLEELSKYFTFDEIFCFIYEIQNYHRYLEKFDL